MTEERGTTEVLGYVLIIALITTMIGVVMTVGVTGLHESQESEQLRNMERAFEVIDANAQKLVTGAAPTRPTELRLGDGSVTHGDEITLNVTVGEDTLRYETEEIDGEDVVVRQHTHRSQPLEYRSGGDSTIVYEAGATIRSDDGHSHLLSAPSFFVEDDTLFIHTVRTRQAGGTPDTISDTNTGMVRKEALEVVTDERAVNDELRLEISSPRSQAWEAYLLDFGFETEIDGDQVAGTLSGEQIDRVIYVETEIRITLSS